jgi:carotenoid cleavage dioxygenase-like enzyme
MFAMAGQFKNMMLYPMMKSTDAVLNYIHNDSQENPFLLGNFAPIEQEGEYEDLESSAAIEGKVPMDLNGVYLRNGPNPKQKIQGKYHWFDGDGMIHSIRIRNGRLFYSNRYVQTQKYKVEETHKQ